MELSSSSSSCRISTIASCNCNSATSTCDFRSRPTALRLPQVLLRFVLSIAFETRICNVDRQVVLLARLLRSCFFHRAGVKFDSDVVDLRAHKTSSGQDFYQINPKGNVPALVTSKGLLSEGPAVMQFIADQAPESKLAPAFGSFERYQLIDTFNYIGNEVHKAYSPLFNPS